ncbi:MAG: fused MFS/spermidine synthase [Coriobacteriia bacterium]|nr:fused MFS/spermidine synthase [Coriobacteriia bacterium]
MLLNVVVLLCGASLMSLEIVGTRVLAPVMGNSIFVWGSLITAVMVALSAGYWLGGRIADRYGSLRTLGLLVLGAGALTVPIPPLAAAVLPVADGLGPRLGPLTAAAAVFFAPALLLATVSPIAVRIAAHSGIERIGSTAGALYALSTAGSILGTLATAFWLIPVLQVDRLIVSTGLLLLVLGGTCSLAPEAAEALPVGVRRPAGRLFRASAGVLGVAGALVGVGMLVDVSTPPATMAGGERIVFRTDSQYHRIAVTDLDGVRSLRFDDSRQSAVDLTDGYTSDILYPDYLHLALAAKPDARRVLVLGLGGGVLAKRMLRDYPEVTIDAVEIDPVVVEVARRYFGLPEDERLGVHVSDARRFVATAEGAYDIVVVDAYYADSLPFHLTTAEFFREIDAVLAPDGVVAYNVIGAIEGRRSELFRSIYRTAGEVWRHEWVFPLQLARRRDPEAIRNIVLLATDSDIPERVLRGRVADRVGGRVTVRGFEDFAEDLYDKPLPLGDVPVLTDRHAPVDSLIRVQ